MTQDTESVKTDEVVPMEIESNTVKALTETEQKVDAEPITQTNDIQLSPKIASPVASAIESRSTDEDLLGGMDIEQISDEELEADETRSGNFLIFTIMWQMIVDECFYRQIYSSYRRS